MHGQGVDRFYTGKCQQADAGSPTRGLVREEVQNSFLLTEVKKETAGDYLC